MLRMFSSNVSLALSRATSTRCGRSSPRALSSLRHCSRITRSPTAAHRSSVSSRRPTSSISGFWNCPCPIFGTLVTRLNLCCDSSALAARARSSPLMSTMKALMRSRNFLSSSSGTSPCAHSLAASATHLPRDSATRTERDCLVLPRRFRPSWNRASSISRGVHSAPNASKLRDMGIDDSLATLGTLSISNEPPSRAGPAAATLAIPSSSSIVFGVRSAMNFSVLWMRTSRVKADTKTASSFSSMPAMSSLCIFFSRLAAMLERRGDVCPTFCFFVSDSDKAKPLKGMHRSSIARHHMRVAPTASIPSAGLTTGSEILRAKRHFGESVAASSHSLCISFGPAPSMRGFMKDRIKRSM
mmetsp:Transcript_12306/g.31800  ORF Transcript_12306/g.31800 Transcript_12306/m.31800 type:complete len:357 (+) Transcript_12306:287-1357(+)